MISRKLTALVSITAVILFILGMFLLYGQYTHAQHALAAPDVPQDTPQPTPIQTSIPQPTPQATPSAEVDFDLDDWNLLLVNTEHPLPEGFTVELAPVDSEYEFDVRATQALMDMLSDGNDQGLGLFIVSAYRSVESQADLFQRRIARWMNTGMDYDTAAEAAATSVAYPGTSEHNLGLAVDILCEGYTTLTGGFGTTQAGVWLAENCAQYGFILRYPGDKTEITGIIYEPWHFRYVGVEAATYITEAGICLEEFWERFGG